MLQISRKLFSLPLNQVYFQEMKCDCRYEPKLVCYTHALKPRRKLQGKKALHMKLTQDDSTWFYRMSDEIITLMEENRFEQWTITRLHHPTNQDIKEFQEIYNLNAKQKRSRRLNKFDVQTLQLLRDQGGLVITRLENESKEFAYFRIYVVGKKMVMALYDEGQALQSEKISRSANYFLCLENMKHFGSLGYQIYDFGDIKDSTRLKELKENFGGELVTVFSGYRSKSPFSELLLQFNLKNLKKRLSI